MIAVQRLNWWSITTARVMRALTLRLRSVKIAEPAPHWADYLRQTR